MKKNVFFICCLLLTFQLQAQQKDSLGAAWKYPAGLQQELNKWGETILQGGVCAEGLRKGIFSWQDYAEIPHWREYAFEPAPITDSMFKKFPGDINIYWIHGLNGNTESLHWPAYATQYGIAGVFDARKVRSVRGMSSSASSPVQFYSEDAGIRAAAADLDNNCHTLVPADERKAGDYIIAHSQGGIVAREWLRCMDQQPQTFERYAHGLVTFGSPHAGAIVINKTREEMENHIPAFMDYACQSVASAMVSESLKKSFMTRLILSNKLKDKLLNMGCDVLSETIIPLALDNYFKRTTLDFYEGAPFLNGYTEAGKHVEGLSEYKQKVPVVQFYGVEEQPVLWRFLSSSMHIGQDKLDEKEAAFAYDEDGDLQVKVQSLINEFDASEIEYNEKVKRDEKLFIATMAASAAAAATLHPGISFGLYAAAVVLQADIGKNKRHATALHKGSEWLRNANITYQVYLLGARVTPVGFKCEVVQNLQCRDAHYNPVGSGVPAVPITIRWQYFSPGSSCNETNGLVTITSYHFSGFAGENLCGNCTGEQSVVKTWKNEYSFEPNDGVVMSRSASWPVPLESGVIPLPEKRSIIEMPKTNHEQMKNCHETKFKLIQLYDGQYGPFFAVKRR